MQRMALKASASTIIYVADFRGIPRIVVLQAAGGKTFFRVVPYRFKPIGYRFVRFFYRFPPGLCRYLPEPCRNASEAYKFGYGYALYGPVPMRLYTLGRPRPARAGPMACRTAKHGANPHSAAPMYGSSRKSSPVIHRLIRAPPPRAGWISAPIHDRLRFMP